jgi:glyoxylase-like metal-dependent hydrolase (beta-lactamase superfamily II)
MTPAGPADRHPSTANAQEVLPICRTCGVQYVAPREGCPVCDDERQYVGWGGQQWTTLEELREAGHRGILAEEGPGVVGVGTDPAFAIGQRALLLRKPSGNVLWDCVTYLDDDLVAMIKGLGGISRIAISHPHYYGTMVEWSRAFDAPVYLHAADRDWVGRPDPMLVFWEGDTFELASDLTLINAGVHFSGGTVMYWGDAPGGRGALFSGDIVQVVMDRSSVGFMYSYPNLIPERPSTIRRALRLLEPFEFDRVYGAWWGRLVETDGAAAVQRSADRYLRFVENGPPGRTSPSR